MMNQIVVLALVALASGVVNAGSFKGQQFEQSEPLKGMPVKQQYQELAKPVKGYQYSAPIKGSSIQLQSSDSFKGAAPLPQQHFVELAKPVLVAREPVKTYYQEPAAQTFQSSAPVKTYYQEPAAQTFQSSAPVKTLFQEPARQQMMAQTYRFEQQAAPVVQSTQQYVASAPVKGYRFEQQAAPVVQSTQQQQFVASEPIKAMPVAQVSQQLHFQEPARQQVAVSSWQPIKASPSVQYEQRYEAPAQIVQQSSQLVSEPIKALPQQQHYQSSSKL